MKTYYNPTKNEWSSLCERPAIKSYNLEELATQIFTEIQRNGDIVVRKYTSIFDGVVPDSLKLTEEEIAQSAKLIPEELKQAIQLAKTNIEKFHISQKEAKSIIETTEGVYCWRESRAIENIGIYIPGGSAPLFSTVLMLAIPAQIAGCKNIVLCTPPDKHGKINDAILYAAQLTGIKDIYCIGGIQAIGAMTLGTESVPKADKIFGPGNQYVTAAKQLALKYGVAIDIPAGPSELLIIADTTANPEYLAADLLSQAEHGSDSQVILLCTKESLAKATINEVNRQIQDLPRREIAEKALRNSKIIVFDDLESCFGLSNQYAPEHLIIACENAENYTEKIINAGSVFLGNLSCESAGDYASGTNHTLPTNGYAKNYSGVSLDSFIRKITFQKISEKGLQNIGPAIEIMAESEELQAHKNAVTIRLKDLNNV